MFHRSLIKQCGLPLILILGFYVRAVAVDHNNVDAGRPLSFDDAEAVAYREMSIESGISGISPNEDRAGIGLSTEFLYGFALNTHAGVDVNAAAGGRAGSSKRDFDVEDVSLNVLHNFNREYGSVPAFSLRGDVALPTEEKDRGVEVRLRGILSKALIQYDRLHVNLDSVVASNPKEKERMFRPGIVLGYTKPLGYPQGFSSTGLGEISVQTPAQNGTGPIVRLGIGLRQQVTVRSVIDMDIQSDVLGGGGAPREDVRVTAGYSIGF